MFFPDERAETAEPSAGHFLLAGDEVEDLASKIIEAKLVDRLWLRIEFDRDEVERERGKAQCLLVDVEAGDLVVEDLAQPLGLGPLAVGAPTSRDELAKSRQEENAGARRRVEDAC